MYIIRVSHENSRYWFISQHTKGVANDVAPPSRQIGPRRCRENVRHQHRSDDVNNGAQYTHTPLPTATSLVPPGPRLKLPWYTLVKDTVVFWYSILTMIYLPWYYHGMVFLP